MSEINQDECSCHLSPPCSFCTSMTDDEADIYANFGLHGLRLYRSNVDETKEKLTAAEARVRELEGLKLGNYITGQFGIWLEVLLPAGIKYDSRLCRTLGEAMGGGK